MVSTGTHGCLKNRKPSSSTSEIREMISAPTNMYTYRFLKNKQALSSIHGFHVDKSLRLYEDDVLTISCSKPAAIENETSPIRLFCYEHTSGFIHLTMCLRFINS